MADKKTQKSAQTHSKFGRTAHARVLVVDDNVDLLKLISIRLKPMQFELKTVTSAEEALSILAVWNADLVITDLQMSGMSGKDLFYAIQAKNPLLPVIILTAHGTIPEAVEATQSGVASYLTKPFDSEALIHHIQIALLASGFSDDDSNQESTTLMHDDHWRRRVISKSSSMENLLRQVESLADGDAIIAFEGESGTGKDELARAMHARSDRSALPLIHLACTSVPTDLLDTEMFGRVGDANHSPRQGLLSQAKGGTVLLSDFNETPVAFLRRLLLALKNKTAQAIDSETNYPVDVRFIVTSAEVGRYGSNNQELWDLSNQLNLTVLKVPPLRERREDIPLIVNHCLEKLNVQDDVQFSSQATQQLLAADWPGNVRHLINVVKQCVGLSQTKIISEALVQSRIGSRALQIQPLSNAHREFERGYLTELLKVTHGNVTKAATLAKRNRTEFHRLLKKHKIEAQSFRQ